MTACSLCVGSGVSPFLASALRTPLPAPVVAAGAAALAGAGAGAGAGATGGRSGGAEARGANRPLAALMVMGIIVDAALP